MTTKLGKNYQISNLTDKALQGHIIDQAMKVLKAQVELDRVMSLYGKLKREKNSRAIRKYYETNKNSFKIYKKAIVYP